jgi:hypothetical protein
VEIILMKRFVSFRQLYTLQKYFLLAAVVGLVMSGCGGKKDSLLAGKVLYKDQPVTGGTVSLVAASPDAPKERAGPYPGTISPQGTYVVSGVPAGEYRVVVETRSIQGMSKGYPSLPPGVRPAFDADSLGSGANAPHYVEIPWQYSDPTQTPLRVTVTGGHQTEDLRLND